MSIEVGSEKLNNPNPKSERFPQITKLQNALFLLATGAMTALPLSSQVFAAEKSVEVNYQKPNSNQQVQPNFNSQSENLLSQSANLNEKEERLIQEFENLSIQVENAIKNGHIVEIVRTDSTAVLMVHTTYKNGIHKTGQESYIKIPGNGGSQKQIRLANELQRRITEFKSMHNRTY